VAEIQRRIVKRGKRNAIAQFLQAKNPDEEKIVAWRLDLKRILRVLEVRSVTSICPSLTFYTQTELTTEAHATVPDPLHDVSTTHTVVHNVHHESGTTPIVFEVRSDGLNTRTTISDIRRNPSKGRKGTDGQNLAVSVTRTLTVNDSPFTTPQAHARSAILTTSGFII
jgi:hypothetical protein